MEETERPCISGHVLKASPEGLPDWMTRAIEREPEFDVAESKTWREGCALALERRATQAWHLYKANGRLHWRGAARMNMRALMGWRTEFLSSEDLARDAATGRMEVHTGS